MRRVGVAVSLVVAAAVALGGAGTGLCRTPGKEDAGDSRESLTEAANSAFKAGDFAAALSALERLRSLDDSPLILYNMAVCHEKLGRTAEALAFFRRYLEGADSPELAAKARARVEALSRAVESGILEVRCTPPGARVEVEGVAPPAHCPARLALRPGTYRLAVRAEGYRDHTRTVRVSAGRTLAVEVALEPVPATLTVAGSGVPGEVALLDGVGLGSLPVTGATVPPGSHVLTVRTPGRPDRVEVLTFRPGQQMVVGQKSGAVAPVSPSPPPSPPAGTAAAGPPAPSVGSGPEGPDYLAWALGAATVLAAAGAGASVLLWDSHNKAAVEEHQRYLGLRGEAASESRAVWEGHAADAARAGRWATGLLVTTGVLAAGLAWRLLARAGQDDAGPTSAGSASLPHSLLVVPIPDGGRALVGWGW